MTAVGSEAEACDMRGLQVEGLLAPACMSAERDRRFLAERAHLQRSGWVGRPGGHMLSLPISATSAEAVERHIASALSDPL
jgi:hypothetical protein